jgi:uncharacterized membrane protein
MKNYFINLFKKLYTYSHILIIPICCGIIVVFWTYLLLQAEVRNSLSLVFNENTSIMSLISVSIYFLFKKFKEFKQELFDKIEREHRTTISYLQSNLIDHINYSTKAILLQEKNK